MPHQHMAGHDLNFLICLYIIGGMLFTAMYLRHVLNKKAKKKNEIENATYRDDVDDIKIRSSILQEKIKDVDDEDELSAALKMIHRFENDYFGSITAMNEAKKLKSVYDKEARRVYGLADKKFSTV